jgi:hypothetical protein
LPVPTDIFRRYALAAREAVSRGLNVDPAVFDSEHLTFVDRQESKPWFTLNAVTFGTGTVVCVDPTYREFAEANKPGKHYRAMSVAFLRSIADEGSRRGESLQVYAPSLCFTIGSEPPDLPLPEGFEFRQHDDAWMNAEQQNGRFENGVGEPGVDGREFRNRFALAL